MKTKKCFLKEKGKFLIAFKEKYFQKESKYKEKDSKYKLLNK